MQSTSSRGDSNFQWWPLARLARRYPPFSVNDRWLIAGHEHIMHHTCLLRSTVVLCCSKPAQSSRKTQIYNLRMLFYWCTTAARRQYSSRPFENELYCRTWRGWWLLLTCGLSSQTPGHSPSPAWIPTRTVVELNIIATAQNTHIMIKWVCRSVAVDPTAKDTAVDQKSK